MTALALDASSRVLALAVARIGDTLLVTPALRALGAAAGDLTVLAHPQRRDVLQNLDFIGELGALTKRSAWLRGRLAPARFDAAFCWGREAALLRYALRVARRCVAFDYPEFAGIDSDALLRVAVPAESSLHAVSERLLLVQAAGITGQDMRLAYSVSAEERQFAQAWLAEHGLDGARPLIGLQPCSFHTKSHRDWPVEHFAALVRRLGEHYPGARLLVLGDAAALDRAAALQQALPAQVVVAAGRLKLRESAAVMQRLDLYIGVDTGPTHIAGALGIPMIALYHPRYPGRNLMPLDNPRCTIIEPAGGGMEGVAVDQVWQAAHARLDGVAA